MAIKWPWQRDAAQPSPPPATAQSGVQFNPDSHHRMIRRAFSPLPKNSSLASLTADPAWQEHAANFEMKFAKLNTKQLLKLHTWQAQYFPESHEKVPVAFYMFSGPDFLYVDQFFPKASVYILCGKESLGPPPDPLRVGNLSTALHNLEEAMYSLCFSFFITKDMKVDLQSQELKGTIPILYVFLARPTNQSGMSLTVRSMRAAISSRAGPDSAARQVFASSTLTIIRTNNRRFTISPPTSPTAEFPQGPGFIRFCDHFGVGCSFLKSSSYLMFEDGFSRVRNFILEHSKTIVQDDAGIPMAHFNHDQWNVRVFGNYIGPIEIFKQHYQPKLAEIYQQSGPPPIDFNFGYRWNYKESNLIVASRL